MLQALIPYWNAFLLTVLIEGILAAACFRNRKTVLFVLLLNLFTNPAVNLLYRGVYPVLLTVSDDAMLLSSGTAPLSVHFGGTPFITACLAAQLLLELGVWYIEGYLLWQYFQKYPCVAVCPKPLLRTGLLYSLLFNAASYLTGIMLAA